MKCPKCSEQIAFDAVSHPKCGWGVRTKPEETGAHFRPPCAHNGCLELTYAEIKLKVGWTPVCKKHYAFHTQLEADEHVRKEGLTTTDQKRAYCREKMADFGKLDPVKHWQRTLETPGLPEPTYHAARAALKKLHADIPE